MYRALHALELHPLTDLNNYSHRPRRTRNALSQRVPLARKHEVDKVAFWKTDTRRSSPLKLACNALVFVLRKRIVHAFTHFSRRV